MNLRASSDAEGVLALAAPPPSPSCACARPTKDTASTRAHMVLTHIFPPLTSALKDKIFKPPFLMAGAIAQDRERCHFPFVLDEKPIVVSVASAGERSGTRGQVRYGAARSNLERAAPLA